METPLYMTGKTKRRPYEPPRIVDLSAAAAQGEIMGACKTGLSAFPHCQTGGTVSANNCRTGSVADVHCQTGSAVTGAEFYPIDPFALE